MNNQEIQEEVKNHQKIFISLAVLTLVSVAIAMTGVGGTLGVIIALGIAFTQGLLILRNLMHLKDSSSMRGLIALTAFFVAYLLFASWLAYSNHIVGTELVHYTPEISDSEVHE
jgi:caa(3)-type oxidase subunit IV